MLLGVNKTFKVAPLSRQLSNAATRTSFTNTLLNIAGKALHFFYFEAATASCVSPGDLDMVVNFPLNVLIILLSGNGSFYLESGHGERERKRERERGGGCQRLN